MINEVRGRPGGGGGGGGSKFNSLSRSLSISPFSSPLDITFSHFPNFFFPLTDSLVSISQFGPWGGGGVFGKVWV